MHINHRRGETRHPKFQEYPYSDRVSNQCYKRWTNATRRSDDRRITKLALSGSVEDIPSTPDKYYRTH